MSKIRRLQESKARILGMASRHERRDLVTISITSICLVIDSGGRDTVG